MLVGEVEDSLEAHIVTEEVAGQEPSGADGLTLVRPLQLRRRAVTSKAEVEHREAAGWVEPATVEPSAFAAQWVVLGAQVPITATNKGRQTRSRDALRLDRHRTASTVTPSRPRPWQGRRL